MYMVMLWFSAMVISIFHIIWMHYDEYLLNSAFNSQQNVIASQLHVPIKAYPGVLAADVDRSLPLPF